MRCLPLFVLASGLFSLSALAAEKQQIGATLNQKVDLPLSDIPPQALAAVKQIQPDFVV